VWARTAPSSLRRRGAQSSRGPVINLVLERNPRREDVDALEEGLFSDLEAKGLPPENRRELAVFVRDTEGQVVAGIAGDVRWEWAKVASIWVQPELQRRGLGSRLMAAFEDAAREEGCSFVRTSTYASQARDFYAKLGYREYATVDDYPPGDSKHYLVKALHEHTADGHDPTPLVSLEALGTTVRVSERARDVVVEPLLKLIAQTVGYLTPESCALLVEIYDVHRSGGVYRVPEDFVRHSPLHRGYRELRHSLFIRPAEGGQWDPSKEVEVCVFTEMVFRQAGETVAAKAAVAETAS
jgi:GNAT superfamily N-acetyltransferase